MFNKLNGNVYFDEKFSIEPDLTLSTFKASNDFHLWQSFRKEKDIGESYFRISIEDSEQRRWHLIVWFVGGVLASLDLSIWLPNESYPLSWDNASEETELKRKSIHDAILGKDLGEGPYEYIWGKITSYFDRKSWGSDIRIIYNR